MYEARPDYYLLDRTYNVRALVDRAGALVERCCYHPYGQLLLHESAGRGDFDNDTDMDGTDTARFMAVLGNTKWDPRTDLDDDGAITSLDASAYGPRFNS